MDEIWVAYRFVDFWVENRFPIFPINQPPFIGYVYVTRLVEQDVFPAEEVRHEAEKNAHVGFLEGGFFVSCFLGVNSLTVSFSGFGCGSIKMSPFRIVLSLKNENKVRYRTWKR